MTLLASAIFWLSGLYHYVWHGKPEPKTASKSLPVITPIVKPPATAIPSQPVGNDTSVSKVPLPLILTGTMPGRNRHEGLAFIGVDKKSPQTYQAGALLVNGVRITEIYSDHVVLERDHHTVILYLDGTGEHKIPAQLKSMLTVGGEAAPAAPAKITHHEVLTDYIRPSPVYDNQMLKGYQVYAGQRSTVFSQLGLEPGDIITSLNGMPLNEPQSAIAQLQQLAAGAAMTATVERQGQEQTISLDGSVIVKDQNSQNDFNVPLKMP
ncbi:MAG: type II secretion system protein N [Steroidobacter sp.]